MLIVSGDISGSARSGTIFIKCFMHSLQNLRVASHAKIIIRAPDCNPLVLVGHVCAGELLGQTIDVIEVAVRLVFVLLVEFGIVEFFVIEFGCVLAIGVDWLNRFDVLRVRDC
jgi:hypothetical protein